MSRSKWEKSRKLAAAARAALRTRQTNVSGLTKKENRCAELERMGPSPPEPDDRQGRPWIPGKHATGYGQHNTRTPRDRDLVTDDDSNAKICLYEWQNRGLHNRTRQVYSYMDNAVNPRPDSFSHRAKYPGDYKARATKASIREQLAWARERLRRQARLAVRMYTPLFGGPVQVIETWYHKRLARTNKSADEIMTEYISWRTRQRGSAETEAIAAAVLAACPQGSGALVVNGSRVSRRCPPRHTTTATSAASATGTTNSPGPPNGADRDPLHRGAHAHSEPVVATFQGPARANISWPGPVNANQHCRTLTASRRGEEVMRVNPTTIATSYTSSALWDDPGTLRPANDPSAPTPGSRDDSNRRQAWRAPTIAIEGPSGSRQAWMGQSSNSMLLPPGSHNLMASDSGAGDANPGHPHT